MKTIFTGMALWLILCAGLILSCKDCDDPLLCWKPPYEPCPPTIAYQGQVYPIVDIGTHCWMARNLDVGEMRNTPEQQVDNGKIEKYCYKNLPANCQQYGGLYTWYEMMNYQNIEGEKGICPPGWHVPTDTEWQDLILNHLMGGYIEIDFEDEPIDGGITRGNHLRLTYNALVHGGNTGFEALEGGRYADSVFCWKSAYGLFWSSSASTKADSVFIYYGLNSHANHSDSLHVFRHEKSGISLGFSVRCLRIKQ